MSKEKLPKWDLESIYPSVTSPEFEGDIKKIHELSENLKTLSSDKSASILSILNLYDTLMDVLETVGSYTYTSFSVNTTDSDVLAAMGKAEKAETAAGDAVTMMIHHLSSRTEEFSLPELKDYSLFLKDVKVSSEHMMSLGIEIIPEHWKGFLKG